MMAKYMRNGVQAVILLSFVIVVCFACLGCANGESINDKGSNGMIEVVRPPCYKDHQQPPSLQYCCQTDRICWVNLGECFTNCPCKINCPPPPATQ
uniref:Uncharacterized protein n=3 Tax=Triticinae TaxID=1648030 RepID=A0A453GWQ3_AEGTS